VSKNTCHDDESSILFRDDFTPEEIARWYADEAEAYTDLYIRDRSHTYDKHGLDIIHAYRALRNEDPTTQYNVLGLGAAGGQEFKPIIAKIEGITILDPSEYYSQKSSVLEVPCVWRKPSVDGSIQFQDHCFDLVTCFSALHHVPNATFVLSELIRVLKPNGLLLLREPIISLGDWRKPRAGLTKRERGIPPEELEKVFQKRGMEIVSKSKCLFPGIDLLAKLGITEPYNSYFFVWVDAILARIFSWNYRYHRTKWWHRVAPRSIYYVVRKS